MNTLTLNDGTVLPGTILESGDGRIIFVYLDNLGIERGFQLFIDPGKTSRIVAVSFDHERVYEGFTQLTAINNEYGNCNITMQKG